MTIVRNTCINVIRANRSRENLETEADERMDKVAASDPSPESVAITTFEAGEVRKAIEGLSPSLRLVLVLREYEQLSYLEIAEAVGISRGTVMSRLFRARERLLQALTRQQVGSEASPVSSEVPR